MLAGRFRTLLSARAAPRLAACGVAAGACGLTFASSRSLCAPAAAKPADSPAAASPTEPAAPSLATRCLAELVGTAIIVQGGCGAVCAAKYAGSGLGGSGVAAVIWGVSVALAAYATRAISGAHLNPAVSCALVATGKAPLDELPWYVAAQCAGGALAGAVNYAVFAAGIAALEAKEGIVRGTARSAAIFHGAFGMVPEAALIGSAGALAAEVYMTAILMFLIFAITDPNGTVPSGAAPALIGATVTTMIGTFGAVTGAGMNPARDLGPRLVTLLAGWGGAAVRGWWIYTLGPVAGGVLGGCLYTAAFAQPTADVAAASARDGDGKQQ